MRFVRGEEIWEIHHEGTQVRIGKQLKRFVSIERAREAYEQQIAERVAQGFIEAPDLITDLDARLVHADELQDKGDPLGELIALQSAPPTPASERRIAKLLGDQHAAIFGPLAPHAARFGVASKTRSAVEVTWRGGFAERVAIQRTQKLALHDVYAQLRRLPLFTQIRELVIGDVEDDSYTAMFATILAEGLPAHLRALEVGAYRAKLHVGDLRPIVAAAGELEVLRVAGETGILGPLVAPQLHTAAIDGFGSAAAALVGSTLPALAELIIRHNQRTMLDRLIDSGIVRRLRRLTLTHCGLMDADLQLILDEVDQFAHLELLELRGNTFGRAIVDRAKSRLSNLHAVGRDPV